MRENVLLDFSVNSEWILAFYTAFLPEPIKMRYCDQKSIDIGKSYEVKFVQNLVRKIFQAASGEFEFLKNYKNQLKILRVHNRNGHMQNISLILVSLS